MSNKEYSSRAAKGEEQRMVEHNVRGWSGQRVTRGSARGAKDEEKPLEET